jgi:hypothetical protein
LDFASKIQLLAKKPGIDNIPKISNMITGASSGNSIDPLFNPAIPSSTQSSEEEVLDEDEDEDVKPDINIPDN